MSHISVSDLSMLNVEYKQCFLVLSYFLILNLSLHGVPYLQEFQFAVVELEKVTEKTLRSLYQNSECKACSAVLDKIFDMKVEHWLGLDVLFSLLAIIITANPRYPLLLI